MRLDLRIGHLTASCRALHTTLHTAMAAALTLCVFCVPCTSVDAHESAPALSTQTADAAPTALASTTPAAVDEPVATVVAPATIDSDPAFEFTLDDQMLSRQRGGAVGMLMVAATPQLMRTSGGNSNVTLWDEIAPPTPLPIPVDAARTTQGNVASYQRK